MIFPCPKNNKNELLGSHFYSITLKFGMTHISNYGTSTRKASYHRHFLIVLLVPVSTNRFKPPYTSIYFKINACPAPFAGL